MNSRMEEILDVLKSDQGAFLQELDAAIAQNRDSAEFGAFFGFLIATIRSPEKVNWVALMNGIESFMADPLAEEQARLIGDFLLDGYSNFISNGKFDVKWFQGPMGLKTRDYLNAYEAYHGSPVRY